MLNAQMKNKANAMYLDSSANANLNTDAKGDAYLALTINNNQKWPY